MSGRLYIVSTPIGNLGDFSPRAVQVLQSVDFIAAEDTRVGVKLLNKFEIKKPQISYFEHNRRQKGEYIVSRILSGESCALITDAGTPAISDPGTDLVALCRQANVEVVSVPGCCAAIAALSISGIECGRFCFEGFLSTNKKSRMEHLNQIKEERRTMVFYEAPHKLLSTLTDMAQVLGDRRVAVCREITKLHEQTLLFTLPQALEHFNNTPPKGEFVLVLEGYKGENEQASPVDYLAEVEELLSQGQGLMSAVKQVSKAYSTPKNALYKLALEKFGDKNEG